MNLKGIYNALLLLKIESYPSDNFSLRFRFKRIGSPDHHQFTCTIGMVGKNEIALIQGVNVSEAIILNGTHEENAKLIITKCNISEVM